MSSISFDTMRFATKRESASAVLGFAGLLLFALYLLLLPGFKLIAAHNIYNELRIQELLLLVAVTGLWLLHAEGRRSWLAVFTGLPLRLRGLLGILLSIGLLSGIRAGYPLFALLEVAHFSLIFFCLICLAAIRRRLGTSFDRLMAFSLACVGWIYLADFIGNYSVTFVHHGQLGMVRDLVLAKFSHVRFFSQWQSWTLPLMVLPLLLAGRLAWPLRLLFLLPAVGWWLLFFMAGTRGTTLGFLVALVLTAVLYRRRAFAWIGWQALSCVGGLFVFWFCYYLLPDLLAADAASAVAEGVIDRNASGFTGRIEQWLTAAEMIGRQPWLGVGPMHFADYGHSIAAHPHNALVQIAVEWGLPALLIVLALFVFGVRGWLRVSDHRAPHLAAIDPVDNSGLGPALFASLITAAVHALFSGIIVMPVSLVMLVLVIGWMIGIAGSQTAAVGRSIGPQTRRRYQVALLFGFSLILAGIAVPLAAQLPILDLVHLRYQMQGDPMVKGPHYFRPRFWQQGYLAPYYPKPG